MTRLVFGFAALLVVAGVARADDDQGWEKLGDKEVAFRADRDVIPVTAKEGRFDAIRLAVTGNGIEVLDLKVHFGNGEVQDFQVRETIQEGGRTRVLDLPGNTRVIERVELVYKTEGKRREGRATVHVWGRQSGPAKGPRERWEVVGTKDVAFGVDRDVITIGNQEGRFTKIQLEAEENGIEVLDVKVVYGNGEHHDVAVREVIKAGARTRVIDLPGEARVLRAIELVYRTEDQKRREGRARIKVHALHAEGAAGQPAAGGKDEDGHPGEGWTKLGEREVTFRAERDTIDCSGEGRFHSLMLVVRGNGVEILDLKVTYGNGDRQDVQVRQRFEAGGSTRAIDLPGGARAIKSVELIYRTLDQKNRDGRAHIRLWGK